MTDEEFVDRLTDQIDLLPRMIDIYDILFRDVTDADMKIVIPLVQAAFWSGMEAALQDEYADFRARVADIVRDRQ